jgi:hypothetical protein
MTLRAGTWFAILALSLLNKRDFVATAALECALDERYLQNRFVFTSLIGIRQVMDAQMPPNRPVRPPDDTRPVSWTMFSYVTGTTKND